MIIYLYFQNIVDIQNISKIKKSNGMRTIEYTANYCNDNAKL